MTEVCVKLLLTLYQIFVRKGVREEGFYLVKYLLLSLCREDKRIDTLKRENQYFLFVSVRKDGRRSMCVIFLCYNLHTTKRVTKY